MTGMDGIECDGALLAACRARQVLLDQIDQLREHEALQAEQEFFEASLAGDQAAEQDEATSIFDNTPATMKYRAQRQLAALDALIADAVMQHLLNPELPGLMVLPRRRTAA